MYPTGADLSSCVTMEPNHGGNTATGGAPYTFRISQADGSLVSEYTIGQVLTSKYLLRSNKSNPLWKFIRTVLLLLKGTNFYQCGFLVYFVDHFS